MDLDRNKLHFLTTFKKDYVKKPISLVPSASKRQEFDDPISEGYKHYLVLDETSCTPPNEDGELFLEKCKEKYKDAGRLYFQEPLQKELIYRNKITKGMVSEYQTNYCDVEKDILYHLEQRERKHNLSDSVHIPLTTYATFFRNPAEFLSETFQKPLIIIPPNNIQIKALRKFRGNPISEYTDRIGRIGGLIIKHNSRGKLKQTQPNKQT